MHVARFLPASIRRAFTLMRLRLFAIFADAPIVFFGVVIGVALMFRVGVGWARDAAEIPVEAPTFATGAEAKKPEKSEPPKLAADPDARPTLPVAGEVGAAGKVQPIGNPALGPAPARVAPRTRGHGRRTSPR